MILIIDNQNSFAYNIYQVVGAINQNVKVVEGNLEDDLISKLNPSHLIICGSGSENLIKNFKGKIPILCLDYQTLCKIFGGTIKKTDRLLHGKKETVHIANGSPIFRGLPPIIKVGMYNALSAAKDSLPEELLVISENHYGEVLALKHKDFEIYGVSFQPDSILTEQGNKIFENFIKRSEKNDK